MKIRPLLLTSLLSCSLFLGACDSIESTDDNEGQSTSQSNKTSSSENKEDTNEKKADLVYYEVLNNGDNTPKVEIGYISPKNHKKKTINTKVSRIKEHVLEDGDDKPYVKQEGRTFHIYRPPYMTYGNDDIEGEITDKKEIDKNDDDK